MNTAEARIIGLFIRSFLYGIYTIIFAHCLRWIFYEDDGWKLRRKVNSLTLTISVLVLISTTTNLVIWNKLTLASVSGNQHAGNGLIAASNGLGRATTLMIDAVLVHRCWIVYSGSWRVICCPLFLLLSNIGIFIASFLCISQTVTGRHYDPRLIEAFYTFNIVINIYATSAIIYQILSVASAHGRDKSKSNLYEICRIIVECGLPYLFSSIFALMITIVNNRYLFPTGAALSSTMNGIAFNLLLIRIGLHRTDPNTGKWSDSWLTTSALNSDVQEKIPPSIVLDVRESVTVIKGEDNSTSLCPNHA